MKKYIQILGLKSDPFQLTAKARSFFGGAGRQEILDGMVRHVHYGAGASVITGPLGSGKTVLAQHFIKSFADEALALSVQASLFMNQSQFLDALLEQLPIGASSPEPLDILNDLVRFANQQEQQARTLVLVIDDAHELASEVFELIAGLMQQLPASALHICLLGENHLLGMLENTIKANILGKFQQFQLEPFSAEDTCEYVQHKLVEAGYQGDLPVAAGRLGAICNDANGTPGAMTSAIADLLDDEIEEGMEIVPVSSALKFSSRYWQAAAALFVVAFLLWITGPGPDEELPTEQIAAETSVSRQQISVPLNPTPSQAEPTRSAGIDSQPRRAAGALSSQSADTASRPAAVATATSDASELPGRGATMGDLAAEVEDSEGAGVESVPHSSPSPPSARPAAMPDAGALSLGPDGYTIQLMGSRSEESVIKFLETLDLPFASGYFETQYQGQPWFVVVAGSFDNRQQASAAIADLPDAVRELQPWVRAASDIQSSVRTLQALN